MKLCRECIYSGLVIKLCRKEHQTSFINGCKKCGDMINTRLYYFNEECEDFDERYYDDPSGS